MIIWKTMGNVIELGLEIMFLSHTIPELQAQLCENEHISLPLDIWKIPKWLIGSHLELEILKVISYPPYRSLLCSM